MQARSTTRQRQYPHGGLTLVEIMVALVVLGVLIAVAVPSMASFMERRRIVAVAEELVGMFQYAKAETNATDGQGMSLHLEDTSDGTSCARLVNSSQLDKCSCSRPTAQVCDSGSSRLVREFISPNSSGVSFTADAREWGLMGKVVLFQRNARIADVKDVAVTVTGARTGGKLRVEYNTAGRVRICAVDGFSGYPTCG